MNTDKKLSLETVSKTIRPHLSHLVFKRLSDYTIDTNTQETVGGITYTLKLWPSCTRGPLCLSSDTKTIGVLTGRHIYNTADRKRPYRIEHERMLLLCPADDTVIWAFQVTKYVPEKHTQSYFFGRSQINIVNDANLRGITADAPLLIEKVWCGLRLWIEQTIIARNEITGRLRRLLDEECTERIVAHAN